MAVSSDTFEQRNTVNILILEQMKQENNFLGGVSRI